MFARTIISRCLFVVVVCMAGQVSSEAQSPAGSLSMTVNFTVRDFQPALDRTGPMNWIARNPMNPSEVFASSTIGGLWRSTDAGNNWTPVRTLQPWSVSAVAFLFDDTPGGAVLVTTREDFRTTSNAGVWRSDDHGESWTQVGQVPAGCSDWPRAHGIAVHGRSAWVATSCGVLQSTDGRIFRKIDAVVYPRGVLNEHFYSVEVNNSGDVLLGGEAGLFYRFRPASAPTGSGMFGNNAEYRRAFAVTPSRRYQNFVLAVSGPRPIPPFVSSPLQISQDVGQTWTRVPSSRRAPAGAGGSPFVRIFPRTAGSPDLFVYYGDSYGLHRAGPFDGGDLSRLATDRDIVWTSVTLGHPDPHDIDFKSLPGEPLDFRALLLATDGGLEICSFARTDGPPTCNESGVIGTGRGLSSIQVMSLRGQIVGSGESAMRRLYFDSWHTDKYASLNDGLTWSRIPGEAAWLDMERRVADAADAQIVYNYNATPNTLSDDGMTRGVNFRDADSAITPPVMLQKGIFVETAATATATDLFAAANVTRAAVTRAAWIRVASLQSCSPLPCAPLSTSDPAVFAGYLGPGKTNPVVYQPHDGGLVVVTGLPVGYSGGIRLVTAGVAALAQMKWQRPSDTLDVLQGIAWTPFTGFGKVVVIAADPLFPSHLVIPDIRNNKVMRSLDGGSTWNPIADLSDAVTRDASGTVSFAFSFDRGGFGNQSIVSSISFFPDDPRLVILGTVENGLFFSKDRAATWQRIPNSEHITNVVGLYWRSANSVIVGSWGRGLFEIHMRYRLSRSSLGLLCGDCRFLPVAPRLASIESPRIVPVSLRFSSEPKQQDFDEAVFVVDGRINGAEVNQGRLQKLWVTIGSSEYRLSDANLNSAFVTEERSGFVGFKNIPEAEQLRSQKQVIKGIGFTNGRITHLIYGSTETPIPVPTPLGTVVLPKETNPQLKNPYLRIFGPDVMLGTIGMEKSFDLQGFRFRPDSPVELRVDGQATGGQLRTDANGRFATRLVAPSAIGPHEIVARLGAVQAAIGFSVNNTDGKRETSVAKKESPDEKKQSPAEKKEILRPDRKDDKVVAAPALVTLPRLLTADELMLAATASGGEIHLVSLSSAKGPEAKSLEWSGMSSADELTLRFDLPAQISVSLYASFLRGPQAGLVRVRVNGQEIGEQLELTSKSETTAKLRLGQVELRPGTNTVTFAVTSSEKGSPKRISLLALSLEK
jgi:hypothetical protein